MIYAPSSLFSTLPDVNFLFCFNKTITLENVLLSAPETDFRTVVLLLMMMKYCCLSRCNVVFSLYRAGVSRPDWNNAWHSNGNGSACHGSLRSI